MKITNIAFLSLLFCFFFGMSGSLFAEAAVYRYNLLGQNTYAAMDAADVSFNSFTAKWKAVEGADSYRLDVSANEDFTGILARYNDLDVSGTSLEITGLNPNSSYYYRVRAFAGAAGENSNTISVKTQRLYVVLMAGQSNMAGRGIYSELSPADTVTYSNIFSLNKDSVWVRARHPLHWDKSEAGVGMGISFAKKLAEQLGGDVAIGLVPCAAGGTSIDAWLADEKFGFTGNFNLYTNLITRAKRAARSGDIAGMIWHQGESNATVNPEGYLNKMQVLFSRIRNDLHMPYMPVVAGELGLYLTTNSQYVYLSDINAAIHKLADFFPYYGVAKSDGLIPNSDNVHFTAASQVELGKRYAAVFYPLMEKSLGTLSSLTCDRGMLSPAFHPDITSYICYVPADLANVVPSVTLYHGDDEVTGLETVDVSSGAAVSEIRVTAKNGSIKTYVVNYKTNNDVDYTGLIVNNDFDLAPDANCNPVAITEGMDGWSNNAWRPTLSTCKNFYGWTSDVDFADLGNTSQGINRDAKNKNGEFLAWIAGNYALPDEIHEFYQIIDKDALSAGTYKVQCRLGVQHAKITTQRLFANGHVQYHGGEYQYGANLVQSEYNTFAGYPTGESDLKEMVVYTTIGENDSLKIGIRTGNKKYDGSAAVKANPMWGWFKTDYFRLAKIDPDIAANADLSAIMLNTGILDFSPETTEYHVLIPEGTEKVTVFAVPSIPDAVVTGVGQVEIISGKGMSSIRVRALDGVSLKTYAVNYETVSSGVQEVVRKAYCFVQDGKLTVSGTDAYEVYHVNGIKKAEVNNHPVAHVDLPRGIYVVRTKNAEVFKLIVD